MHGATNGRLLASVRLTRPLLLKNCSVQQVVGAPEHRWLWRAPFGQEICATEFVNLGEYGPDSTAIAKFRFCAVVPRIMHGGFVPERTATRAGCVGEGTRLSVRAIAHHCPSRCFIGSHEDL